MKFDNAQFEKNCKETMSTLDKLKEKLHSTKSASGLDELSQVSKGLGLDVVDKSLESINKKMSILGVAGATVISELTKSAMAFAKKVTTAIPNIIKEGGWTRAMNIEQAKFQLEGLGIAWADVGEQISNAVSGTAYSMDSAAKAASQLAASGVQISGVGDDMERSLKAISGVAAQTNSSYDDIANIFTTVAGNGRLMGDQLRQLSTRGMNAAAALGKAMGITEAEVRDMVSHGQISFQQFSDIMYETFGENAFKANQTFSGSLDNMKAALKRTGEAFAGPVIRQMIPVFNSLRTAINRANTEIFKFSSNNVTEQSKYTDAIKAAKEELEDLDRQYKAGEISQEEYATKTKQVNSELKELQQGLEDCYGPFEKVVKTIQERVVATIDKIDFKFLKKGMQGLINILQAAWSVIKPFGQAIADVFGISTNGINKTLTNMAAKFEIFTRKLILSTEEMNNLKRVFRGIISVTSMFSYIIKSVIAAIMGVNVQTVDLRKSLLKILGSIGDAVYVFTSWIKESNIITVVMRTLMSVLYSIAGVIALVVVKVGELISYVRQSKVFQTVLNGIQKALTIVVGSVVLLAQKVAYIFSELKKGNLTVLGPLGTAIEFIKNGVLLLVGAIQNIFEKISNLPVVTKIINKVTEAFQKLKDTVMGIFGKKSGSGSDTVTITDDDVPKGLAEIKEAAKEAGDEVKKSAGKFDYFNNILTDFRENLSLSRVASIVFVGALVMVCYKIADAMQKMAVGVKGVGTFASTFAKKGLIGMILGTRDRTPNKILDTAMALGILAASLFAFSKIPSDKLKEATKAVTDLMIGYTVMMGAMVYLDSMTGTIGGLNNITGAMLKMTIAIAGMSVAMKTFATMDGDFIKGVAGVVFAGGELVGIAILMSKFAPAFSVAAGSMIGMALSIKIMGSTFKMLLAVKDEVEGAMQMVEAFATFVGVLVAVASFAQRLGGSSSFMRLSISILALAGAATLIYKLLGQVDVEQLKTLLDAWSAFFKDNLPYFAFCVGVGVASLALVYVTLKSIPKLADAIFGKVKQVLSSGRTLTDEVKTTVNYMAASLNKLGIAAIILSATAAIVALAGLVVILSKIKDKQAVQDAMYQILLPLVGMVSLLMIISSMTEKAKPSALFASIIAIGVILGSIMAISLMVKGDLTGTLIGLGGTIAIMAAWLGMLKIMSAIKFDEPSYKGVIASIVGIGVIVGGIYYLAQTLDTYGIGNYIAAIVGLGVLMVAWAECLKIIGSKGMVISAQKRVAIAECIIAMAVIAGSLIALTQFAKDGDMLITSMIALGGVFAAFGYVSSVLGSTPMNPTLFKTFWGIAIDAIAIGAALSLMVYTMGTNYDAMVLAAGALASVAAIFGVMAYGLSKIVNPLPVIAAFASMAGLAIVIAASLAILCQYEWEEIKNALAGLVGAAVILAGVTAIITAVVTTGVGALAMGLAILLAGAFALIAYSNTLLVRSLSEFLPIFKDFITSVLYSFIDNAAKIRDTGEALVPFAGGLALVGAAGIVLGLGGVGLTAAALLIPKLVEGLAAMAGIDWNSLNSGLTNFLLPALGLGVVTTILSQCAPAMIIAAAALYVFAVAVGTATDRISKDTITNLEKLPQQTYAIGVNSVKGLSNGLFDGQSIRTLRTTAASVANMVLTTIRGVLGIHSPSTETTSDGMNALLGFNNGLSNDQLWNMLQKNLSGNIDTNILGTMDIADDTGDAGADAGDAFIREAVKNVNSGIPLLDMAVYKIKLKFEEAKNYFSHINEIADSVNNKNKNFSPYANGIPTDVQRNLQELAIKEKEASENATELADTWETDLTPALSSGGGAAKSTAKEVKDLTSAFQATEKGTKVSLDSMINNLVNNYKDTAAWARDMKFLIGKGYDTAITDWVKSMGVAGHETVKALMNGTAEQVVMLNTAMKQYLTLDDDAENYILGKYDAFGQTIATVLSDAVQTYDGVLAETIQSALDPFGAFNLETEMSSAELLENMRSQLTGITNWTNNLMLLMERNTDGSLDGIIEYFKEVGISSYDELNAMAHMTDAQLAEAGQLWSQQLDIGITSAKQIAAKSAEIGTGITDGLINNMDSDAAYGKGMDVGLMAIKGAKEGAGVNSPSWKTAEIGMYMMMGLENAIKVRMHIPENLAIMTSVRCINQFKQYLSYSAFFEDRKSVV